MGPAVLLAVDENPARLETLERELGRRYGQDYRVICMSSAGDALQGMAELASRGEPVAIVLAAQWMKEMTGSDLLGKTRGILPLAKRLLVIEWGDLSTSRPILRAVTLGQIDFYVTAPSHVPDEQFHRVIGECLEEWSRIIGERFIAARVVGAQNSARAQELRDVLGRNGISFTFLGSDTPEGRALLRDAGSGLGARAEDAALPVLVLFDGRSFSNPSNSDIARLFGVSNRPDGPVDLVVIGGGPAGLAAAVSASSEGLSTVLLEREAMGGQAGSSSLIRNYLGFPRGVSGAELASRAFAQAWMFGTVPLFAQPATGIHRTPASRHLVSVADGPAIETRCIILATGISYRRLGIPALEQLVGAGVYYGAAVTESPAMEGLEVFVVGAGNSAGQSALHLAKFARRVMLLCRGASLSSTMSEYLVTEIGNVPSIEVLTNTEVVGGGGTGMLEWLELKDMPGRGVRTVRAAGLFVLIGAQPRTEWLPADIARSADGYVLTGADIPAETARAKVAPVTLETSVPGIFAAGDARFGSVKRVASAVGEGAAAVALVHRYLADAGRGR